MTAVSAPIVLTVYGVPAPQGSKTAYVRGGRAIVTEGGSKTGRQSHEAWRQAVATAARDWCAEHPDFVPIDGPVKVGIFFRFPKPKSAPKRRLWPDTRPDLDKCARSVLDSISKLLITDDSRIVDLHASKHWADGVPFSQVKVWAL